MNKNLPSVRTLRQFLMPAVAALTLAIAPKAHAQLTPGNVVVLQAGDGAAALNNGAAAVILKEFSPTGTAGTSITVPTTGSHRLVIGGTSTTEGIMTLSSDSTRLVFVGYDTTTAYAASVSGSASSLVARVVDTVSSWGIPGRVDSTRSAFSTGSIRCATRNNAENYWAVGANTGTYYMGNLQSPGVVQNSTTNLRFVLAANGNLYYATASIISKITGQPTATGSTPVAVLSGLGGSVCGFAINSAETIMYIADERASPSGGIQKWTYSAGAWTFAYTFAPSITPIGTRSVIVDWSGASPVLYATTTDNRLVKFTDPGTQAGVTSTVLATAATNTAFRSVAFAPKAAPTCTNPVIVATPVARKCSGNGSISLAVTSAATPTYSWTGPSLFSATTQNITNLAAGTYTVTATVTGGCSATATATVIDSASFTATLTPSGSLTRCQGDSVLLTTNSGTGYTYQFNNASGAITGATASTYKAGATGVYTVTTIAGPNCTSTSAPVSLTVNPLPVANITPAGPLTICPRSQVVLHTNPATGLTYQWRINTAAITLGGSDSVYTVPGTAGSYTVLVTNTATACSAISTPVVVNLYTAPDTSVTTSNGALGFCTGDSLKLKGVSVTGTTYQWRNIAGNISGATDSAYYVHTAGTYKLVVTTANGCVDSSNAHVIDASTRPVATISSSADTACEKGSITLSASTGVNYTYAWLLQGQVIANATAQTFPIIGFNAGAYDVTVIVTNANGCTDTSAIKRLTYRPLPQPVVVYSSGVLSTAVSYSTYQWTRNGLNIAGATNATFTPALNGDYNVRVSDGFGCSDTSAQTQVVTGVGIPTIPYYAIDGVKVYPNPATDVINIGASKVINIQLRDMQGRVVMTVADAKTLDISTLANGIYMLSATDKTGATLGTTRITKSSK